MTLVADNHIEKVNSTDLTAAIGRWSYSSPSKFLHHGKACCSIARTWLLSMDHSQLNGQHQFMGPRWVRRKYDWGPSQWPMTWCEAVEREFLDCGALAALTSEIFANRGVVCHRVELIQQYTDDTTDHWTTKWNDHPASTHWIQGPLIYHEGCAIETNAREIKIWDPSSGWWANPKQFGGYGSILAVRVTVEDYQPSKRFIWNHHEITSSEWHILETLAPSRVSKY